MEPLSITPDQLWFGNDGPWSSFSIGYGTPAQYVKSLISTSVIQPFVILPEGCIASDPSDCKTTRGGLFYPNQSSTWSNIGDYELTSENNLDININGDFGIDNITLGLPGSGAPSIGHQTVVGIVAKDYYLATWGLRPVATMFAGMNSSIPSLLQYLKFDNMIPSLSWGYTAGSYQISQDNQNGLGSLVIGGYDSNRFEENNTTFTMANDTDRDLVVELISIQLIDGSISLLPNSVPMSLDSGVSQIWLPEEACQRFQTEFNLTYDSDLNLYFVSDATHTQLLASNPTIEFTINNGTTISATSTPVTIKLPYSAFDLQLTEDYPGNNATRNYFPIRQAANSSQYTLGRTFFQHAYVIADYERSIFFVQNALFPAGSTQNLVAIYPVGSTNATEITTTTEISVAAIAGIVVGSLAAIALLLILYSRLKIVRKRRLQEAEFRTRPALVVDPWNEPEFKPDRRFTVELHGTSQLTPELGGPPGVSHNKQYYEMPAEEVATCMTPHIQPKFEKQG